MKFPDIPIGSHFLIKDERYLKVGPLTARRESDGKQRMISRATVVTPDEATSRPKAPETTRPSWLSKALAAYEQELLDCLAPAGSTRERRAEIDAAIAHAREAFNRSAG